MLVSTKRAAEVTGLSEWELRRGWKTGRYPALVIGNGGDRPRLRWNLETLLAAIEQQMDRRGGD